MSPSPEMPLTDSERQNLRDMCVGQEEEME